MMDEVGFGDVKKVEDLEGMAGGLGDVVSSVCLRMAAFRNTAMALRHSHGARLHGAATCRINTLL